MLHIVKLLLPALIPSWNFFDVIVPSPRIQYALLNSRNDSPTVWQVFRPLPQSISFLNMLQRMLWNPYWNESLFLVSCAERLMEYPTQHSEDEIFKRLIFELNSKPFSLSTKDKTHVQFRLILIRREGNELKEQVTYQSSIQCLDKG